MELQKLINCKNKLRIYGVSKVEHVEVIKAFKYGFFNHFVPMPWELHGVSKLDSVEDALDLGIYAGLPEIQSRPLLAMHPSRSKQRELKKRYGYSDSESWALANWGIRWDINSHQNGSSTFESENEIIIEFDVEDRCVPLQGLLRISEALSDSVFMLLYRDGSLYSGGEFICSNGKWFSHQELQLEHAFEYFKSNKELLRTYIESALEWHEGTLDTSEYSVTRKTTFGEWNETWEDEAILEHAFLECVDDFLNASPNRRESMILNEFMIPLGPTYIKGGSDLR